MKYVDVLTALKRIVNVCVPRFRFCVQPSWPAKGVLNPAKDVTCAQHSV